MDKLLNIIQRNLKLRLRCQKKKKWSCGLYSQIVALCKISWPHSERRFILYFCLHLSPERQIQKMSERVFLSSCFISKPYSFISKHRLSLMIIKLFWTPTLKLEFLIPFLIHERLMLNCKQNRRARETWKKEIINIKGGRRRLVSWVNGRNKRRKCPLSGSEVFKSSILPSKFFFF